MNPKVLISGSTGQLGQELFLIKDLFHNYDLLFFDRNAWNISNVDQTKALILEHRPTFIINCAAFTAVDLAEDQADQAFLINSEAVKTLADYCHEYNIFLIHISTDYVFHGTNAIALEENSIKNPQGIYAKSKSLGEDYIIDSKCMHIILRTSWVYSQFGNNFVKTMLRLGATRKELAVVNDQNGCPTHAASIALFIAYLLQHYKLETLQEKAGIYHYSDSNPTNWFEFANKIFEIAAMDVKVNAISTVEFNAKAPRPLFSILDTQKLQNTFNYKIHDWDLELNKCMRLLNV